MRHRRGFTIVELLVVIAIITLLIALLLPSLARAKENARRVVCLSNQHQIAVAYQTYAHDNRGYFMQNIQQTPTLVWQTLHTRSDIRGKLLEYGQVTFIHYCPSARFWQSYDPNAKLPPDAKTFYNDGTYFNTDYAWLAGLETPTTGVNVRYYYATTTNLYPLPVRNDEPGNLVMGADNNQSNPYYAPPYGSLTQPYIGGNHGWSLKAEGSNVTYLDGHGKWQGIGAVGFSAKMVRDDLAGAQFDTFYFW